MSSFARSNSHAARIKKGDATLTSSDDPGREINALRERISRLSVASVRISGTLDLETVLHEVAVSARALTGARYGAIVTIGDAGQPQEFVTSGITEDEHRHLAEWPDGPRLFEHFRDLPGTLSLSDVPAYVRSLGFSSDRLPYKTFQSTPMRHRGLHVGNFYLCDKEGGQEFTKEDEEVLVLFASQAATAIANARTHRAEQRARADLEALVDTSPVGVAVFDARTGNLKSLNREMTRLVESLRTPGHPSEALLKVITCRRADGREIALLNATPIHSEYGTVESVVVTMQDLGPVQELERLRAEFLGMVSHELRAPLTSIKGASATVLAAARVLDPAEVRQLFRIIDEQANHMDSLISDLLDAGRIEAGTLSVVPEPSEVAALVDVARNTFLSGGGRHTVLIDLPADLPRVMADRQRIAQVLNNLFSNAVRHAPVTSPIQVSALRDGIQVAISVRDEGRGVDPERLPHLFRKYGARGGGNRESGSGLGLAICKGLVEAHGGRIWADSAGAGQGTCITFTIPVAHDPGGASGSARSDLRAAGEVHEPTRILVVDDPQTLRYVFLPANGQLLFTLGSPKSRCEVVSPSRHQYSPHLEPIGALIGTLNPATTCASAASATSRAAPFSAAQLLKLVRNPCVVASIPVSVSSLEVVMLLSALPVGLGNSRADPSVNSCAAASTSSVRVESGTRCVRPDFMRSAGTVHTRRARSISSQVASRASPDRAAVRMMNSNSSLVAGHAPDARTLVTASATSAWWTAR